MKEPIISVIMCSFNTPTCFLVEAVNSILCQSFKNFELIIIDDGSNPKIDKSLFSNDPRIMLVRNEVNKGISYSRNKGLMISRGKYIAIMDSDDIALPNRLEKQLDFLECHNDVVVCGTWFEFFGDAHSFARRVIDDHDYYRASLLFENSPTILDPSTMIRKSSIEKIGFKYNEGIKIGMDYLMWVQLSQIGKITNVKSVLMKYRVHKKQITQSKNINKLLANWEIIKYELELLGLSNIEQYKDYFVFPLSSSIVTLKMYRDFLDKLLLANSESCFFNQESLARRIEKQWKLKILNTKKLSHLIKGCRDLPKYKFEIIKVFLKHFNIFAKDKTN